MYSAGSDSDSQHDQVADHGSPRQDRRRRKIARDMGLTSKQYRTAGLDNTKLGELAWRVLMNDVLRERARKFAKRGSPSAVTPATCLPGER